jgi:hypothetical protein
LLRRGKGRRRRRRRSGVCKKEICKPLGNSPQTTPTLLFFSFISQSTRI